jgi:hypothetical protein
MFQLQLFFLLHCEEWDRVVALSRHKFVTGATLLQLLPRPVSLFLPECACTTIIDISSRIFSLMYCWCVSIIIVICICPPGALIWLINLFLYNTKVGAPDRKLGSIYVYNYRTRVLQTYRSSNKWEITLKCWVNGIYKWFYARLPCIFYC